MATLFYGGRKWVPEKALDYAIARADALQEDKEWEADRRGWPLEGKQCDA